MELTTPIKIEPLQSPLPLNQGFLSLGSCFAERIGQKLKDSFLDVTVNPGGVLYNPVSLAGSLSDKIRPANLFLHQSLWRSLEHHSQVSSPVMAESRKLIEEAETKRTQALQGAHTLLLTLGTARVFRLESNGKVVANCHRLPQSLFRTELLGPIQVVSHLELPLHNWLNALSNRQVLLTVSPIRHLRPSLIENSRSKASLILACDELARNHPRIHYFPAYEILMDELRDYRFYDHKMVQPSPQATEYVWQKFQEACFEETARNTLNIASQLRTLLQHRVGPRTDTKNLARKGLALLDQLESGVPVRQVEHLRIRFEDWLVDKRSPTP